MTNDLRRACPECGSLDISIRVRLGGYRCGECKWTGGVTDWRKEKQRQSPLPGLAGVLEAMDPDDVGGDA